MFYDHINKAISYHFGENLLQTFCESSNVWDPNIFNLYVCTISIKRSVYPIYFPILLIANINILNLTVYEDLNFRKESWT